MTCSTPSMINGSIYYFAPVVAVIGGDDDDAVINDAHSKCLLHFVCDWFHYLHTAVMQVAMLNPPPFFSCIESSLQR